MSDAARVETAVEVHETLAAGPVVECVFRGKHEEGSAEVVTEVLTSAVERHRPQVLVVNLLEFHYRFGDDIGGALVAGRSALHRHSPSASCRILAQGKTATALGSLMEFGRVFSFFGDRLFDDLDSAVADVRKASG